MMIKNIHTIIQYSNKLPPPRNIRLSSNSYHQPPMERRFSAKSLWAQFSRKEFPPLIFTIITAEWDERREKYEGNSENQEWNTHGNGIVIVEMKLIFCKALFCMHSSASAKAEKSFFFLFLINDQLVPKKTQLSTASMWVWKMLSV